MVHRARDAGSGGAARMVAEVALVASAEDLLYEEDILRNAQSVRYWVRYLEAKRDWGHSIDDDDLTR